MEATTETQRPKQQTDTRTEAQRLADEALAACYRLLIDLAQRKGGQQQAGKLTNGQ